MNLLQVENLQKHFPAGRKGLMGKVKYAKAVDGVSLTVGERETMGLVGESGCGKSTLGRTVLRLIEPTGGKVYFKDEEITGRPAKELRPFRKKIQMIFQDPYSSLNPRMTIGTIVQEPLIVHGLYNNSADRSRRTKELLELVGIRGADGSKYPNELSGGQRQRVMIARVLATEPKLVIADEPVSALDVSIQSQILNLMRNLMDEFGISYLFISHDVGVVKFISDNVAVMYLGIIVESGETNTLLSKPLHPYTQSLMDSLPGLARRKKSVTSNIKGEVPSCVQIPSGCRFHTRCPHATDICRVQEPSLISVSENQKVACHLYSEGGGM